MTRYFKACLPPLLLNYPILPDDSHPPSYASCFTWLPTSDSVFKPVMPSWWDCVAYRVRVAVGRSLSPTPWPRSSRRLLSVEPMCPGRLWHRRSRHPLAPLLGVLWRSMLDGIPSFSFCWRWRASCPSPWSSSSQKSAAKSSAVVRFQPPI